VTKVNHQRSAKARVFQQTARGIDLVAGLSEDESHG
jgi:hypothetical protein